MMGRTNRQTLLKTKCGHKVKSVSERKIDDWLYRNGWYSVYEPPLKVGKGHILSPDWVLLPQNGISKPVIIEYWGLSILKPNASNWAIQAQPDYQQKRKKKEEYYLSSESFHYIGLTMPDLKDLDVALGSSLEFLME